MTPLLIALAIALLAWWLVRPRKKRRRVYRNDPYADQWTPLRTFRTSGGVTTTVYEVKRNPGINHYGKPIWHTDYAWYCDCAAGDSGYDYRHPAQRDAIHHHGLHAGAA